MLKRLRVSGFKSLGKIDLELGAFHVVVGPNAAGKTSLLQSIDWLARGLAAKMESKRSSGAMIELLGGASRLQGLVRSGSLEDARIGVLDETGRSIEFAIPHVLPREREDLWISVDGSSVEEWSGMDDSGLRDLVLDEFAHGVRFVRFEPSRLREPVSIESSSPTLQSDGYGLAGVLQEMLSRRDARLEAIERSLISLIPGALRIRVTLAEEEKVEKVTLLINGKPTFIDQVRKSAVGSLEIEFRHQGWIPADHVSDGTLMLLGVLVAAHLSKSAILLIDDIDHGLHPLAQQETIRLLKSLAESNSGLQVIATSHSPFVLNAVDPSEVLVAGRTDSGDAAIRPLVSHPEWKRNEGFLLAGEFWSAVGESWVAGQAS